MKYYYKSMDKQGKFAGFISANSLDLLEIKITKFKKKGYKPFGETFIVNK